MRTIDLASWPRREHFKFFKDWGYPHFNVCANVDVSAFYPAVKQRGVSFTVATAYVLARAANTIPEFRTRIRGDQVIEHETVHPGFTILTEGDLFTFCILDYSADFATFAARAAAQIAYVKQHPALKAAPQDDHLLYMTAVPWISFTSVMHPLNLSPVDSVPRLAWGKFFYEGDALKMPLSVQAHHALMDGVHAGRYYELVQTSFDEPEVVLGPA